MNRTDMFNFRISKKDRECLAALALKARRSLSDTLRLLIRDAYAEMLVVKQGMDQKVTHEVEQ